MSKSLALNTLSVVGIFFISSIVALVLLEKWLIFFSKYFFIFILENIINEYKVDSTKLITPNLEDSKKITNKKIAIKIMSIKDRFKAIKNIKPTLGKDLTKAYLKKIKEKLKKKKNK